MTIYNTSSNLLDSMPPDREGARAWLNALKFADFDRLWVSGITSLVAEGDMGAGDVGYFLASVRERYRGEVARHAAQHITKKSLNETQVRILRRIGPGMDGVLSRAWGVARRTVLRARGGATYQEAA